ncbi:hypothetical protein CLM82_00235, partial [Streptomyces albidoflavus]|uniref:SCO5717 family growth-regulating ATPase n=1 Tax=Streptomyces albidoflavus TaxID=1886 RepID=UPI000BD73983
MSSDRDGFRGGGNTPVDDQADVESAAETTGEYTFRPLYPCDAADAQAGAGCRRYPFMNIDTTYM